ISSYVRFGLRPRQLRWQVASEKNCDSNARREALLCATSQSRREFQCDILKRSRRMIIAACPVEFLIAVLYARTQSLSVMTSTKSLGKLDQQSVAREFAIRASLVVRHLTLVERPHARAFLFFNSME